MGEPGATAAGSGPGPDATDRVAVSDTLAAAGPASPPGPTTGARVGRYVVLAELGRGGMGRVHRAYDPKLQREVALKEMYGGHLGEVGSRRLVEEARAMARLSHPNVVAVYDVESIDGRIVLAMELVDGGSLREWVEAEPRPWRDVVDRFIAAGRGLAAAHAAGLLHRDFKPANVLVQGDVVKVTDFGLAKATRGSTDSDLGASPSQDDGDGLTAAGTVVGTLRYMAPEQHRGKTLTAAVDQYALCVSLWEALAGAPPFSGRGPEGLLRAKEGGPPAAGPEVPRPILEALRRGLAPEPEDRWPDLDALLTALRFDPVRRRRDLVRGGVIVGAVGLSVLGWLGRTDEREARCAGAALQLTGVWDDARRADVQAAFEGIGASYAADVWRRSAARIDAYASAWTTMHTEACEATTIRGEQSAEAMDLRMACLHRAKVQLAAAADVLATADAGVVERAHAIVEDLPALERCADVEALRAEVEPPGPGEAEAVEDARARLAGSAARRLAGRYDAAQVEVDGAKARLRDDAVEYGPVFTEVALEEGLVLQERGEYEASVAAFGEAIGSAATWNQRDALRDAVTMRLYVAGHLLERFEQALQDRPLAEGLAAGEPEAEATLLDNLAAIDYDRGDYDAAVRLSERAVALREDAFGSEDPRVANSVNNLATALSARGERERATALYERALAIRREAFGPDHPLVADSLNNLAGVYVAAGDYDAAIERLQQAIAIRRASVGPAHPAMARAQSNLAGLYAARGEYDEAAKLLEEALATQEKAVGPDHPMVAAVLGNLANVVQAQGDHERAIALSVRSVAILEDTLGPDHPDVATGLNNLGVAYRDDGRLDEAMDCYQRSLSIREAALGPDHPLAADSAFNLATLYQDRGEYARAQALLERARRQWEAAYGDTHPKVASVLGGLADNARLQGRPAEGLALAERALAMREGGNATPGELAWARFVLARALLASGGSRDRAVELARLARQTYLERGDADAERLAEVDRWLAAHGASP